MWFISSSLCRTSTFRPISLKGMHSLAKSREIRIPIPCGHIAGSLLCYVFNACSELTRVCKGKVWNESGDTPVLALHGWMDNCGTWEPLVPFLPPSVCLISIDFPGHGYSSPLPPSAGFCLAELLISIERAVRHFGWDKVNILGHSMGGGAGMLYAGTFPEKVNKLVLMDMIKPLSVQPLNQPDRTAKSISELLEAEIRSFKDPPTYNYDTILQKMVQSYSSSVTETSAKVLLKRGARELPDGQFCFTYDPRLKVPSLMSMSVEQQRSFASRVQCEMLILKALDCPNWESPDLYDQMLEEYSKNSKFKMITVPGTHHVHMNEPEIVAPYINEFFSEAVQICTENRSNL